MSDKRLTVWECRQRKTCEGCPSSDACDKSTKENEDILKGLTDLTKNKA